MSSLSGSRINPPEVQTPVVAAADDPSDDDELEGLLKLKIPSAA